MTATLSHDLAVDDGEAARWWASPACEALSGAVDVLAGAGVPVSDAELGGDLIGVRREINRLEAMFCERAGVFDARRAYAVDGAVSAASWLRNASSMAPGGAAGRVRVGRRLEEMPKIAAAFAAGEIGYEHVSLLARFLPARVPVESSAVEDQWVTVAKNTTPAGFRRVLDYFLADLADDGGAERDRARREGRRLHISSSLDAMVFLDGLLDPEAGRIVAAAIEAIMRAHPDVEDEPARSPAQRRADALLELCARSLDDGAASRPGRERPHVSAIIDLLAVNPTLAANLHPTGDGLCACGRPLGEHPRPQATDDEQPDEGIQLDDMLDDLLGATGEAVADTGAGRCADLAAGPASELDGIIATVRPARLYDPDRYCELDTGEPICTQTARRLLCDCAIVRILTAGTSEPIDVGRKTRTIPAALRRALEFRDRHCQYPGCNRPHRGPTRTTPSTGSTADPPRSATSCCCAGATTSSSTKAATRSTAAPTATSTSPAPTAPEHPDHPTPSGPREQRMGPWPQPSRSKPKVVSVVGPKSPSGASSKRLQTFQSSPSRTIVAV